MITEFRPRRRPPRRAWIVAAGVALAVAALWFFANGWTL